MPRAVNIILIVTLTGFFIHIMFLVIFSRFIVFKYENILFKRNALYVIPY